MHQVQIHIVKPQVLQAQLEILLDTCMICAPELGGHKEILALDFARCQSFFDPISDLYFVLVAERRVDVPVSNGNRMANGPFYLAGARLPSACRYIKDEL